jgi:cyclohexanecarboxylate-CoA ligase
MSTFWDLVTRRASETPDAVVVVDDSGDVATASELVERAEAVGRALHASGVGPGDVVSWTLPSSTRAVVLCVALTRLGVVQNPLVPIYGAKEFEFITRQAGSRLLVTPGTFRGVDFDAIARGFDHLDTVRLDELDVDAGGHLPPPPVDADEARWLFYTSGTTSEPKGVRHSDRTILATGTAMKGKGAVPGGRWAGAVPITHVGVPTMFALGLDIGMSIHLVAVFDPQTTCDAFRDWDIDVVAGVGAVVTAMLQRQRATAGPAFPALRTVLAGGGPKIPGLHEALRDELGAQLLSSYGMTEVPCCVAGAPDDPLVVNAVGEGRPNAGCEVRIVGEDGRVLAPGQEGEVRVRGPQMFHGYVDASLDAGAVDEDGFFRSGDLGYLGDEGHLVITGRLKEVVIRNGENLSTREIEDLLVQHPAVAEAVVLGLPHAVTGECVCAAVVLRPGAGVSLEELRAFCIERELMRQKLPERLEIVERVPRNPMGKALKADLKRALLTTAVQTAG